MDMLFDKVLVLHDTRPHDEMLPNGVKRYALSQGYSLLYNYTDQLRAHIEQCGVDLLSGQAMVCREGASAPQAIILSDRENWFEVDRATIETMIDAKIAGE